MQSDATIGEIIALLKLADDPFRQNVTVGPAGSIHASSPPIQNAIGRRAGGRIADESQLAQWQDVVMVREPFDEPVIVILGQ